ncbi:uncharacterized protein LOC116182761 [Photinus pyralis]|uniref:uncharacterized protein LOC116170221 n=1 Tax=Photinus pyralis TaxID=7054 RepID=UPI001267186F|nr:uncharacterized protein LOC116170221 [Photinus pyralis]XP_031342877.1 uncharacterized protein LOC116170551 isoform X2 [Photinus pyralis]XP_031359164.1 uncharacterized protein LOC116182761 [Photinus pyralis]
MSHRRELTAVNHQFDQPVNLEQGTRGRLYNIAESEGALSDYVAQKWGPSICRVVLICAYGMALFTFITGIVYMTYCPRQYHIAGYLIIGVFITIRFVRRVKPGTYIGLGWVFSIGLFILGCVWIYKVPQLNIGQSFKLHCDPVFHIIAFWIVTVELILIALGICALCITCYI